MLSQKYSKFSAIKLSGKILRSELNQGFYLKPYKHLIIDNAIDNSFANLCLKNFPSLDDKKNWDKSNLKSIEVKYRSNWESEFDIPKGLLEFVRILNSSIILKS